MSNMDFIINNIRNEIVVNDSGNERVFKFEVNVFNTAKDIILSSCIEGKEDIKNIVNKLSMI